jgi:hypothetical protein
MRMIEFNGMTFCPNCKEYKGIVFDEDAGEFICIFCQ